MEHIVQVILLFFVVVLLTHDDIVLVAFAVAEVAPEKRRLVIFSGIASSVLLRVFLALAALALAGGLTATAATGPLQSLSLLAGGSIVGLTLIIGLLRLWRSFKVYRRMSTEPT